MSKCSRPDCSNPLKTGGKYCSPKCAALDRSRVKAEKVTVISSGKTIVDDFPASIMATVDRAVAEEGRPILLQEMSMMLQEGNIPIPEGGNTLGDWTLSFDGKKEYRSNDTLDFDKIDMILRSGPATFAMEMKRAMIARNFSRGRFKIESPDKELASVAQAVLEVVLPTMADEFTWSALVYGTSFQEQVWTNKTKYELGLSSSRSAGTSFAVPDVPNSVSPKTIDHIRRGANYKFDGFEQKPKANSGLITSNDNIVVKPPAALVIPFNSHFRNLWGQSLYKPIYPIWLWYEITLRTLARYMERMAMPVALGKAPMRGALQIEGQTAPVKSMDLMLAVAANVAKSNAVVIPSDYDEAGHAKYDLSYLTAQEKGSEFISVLRLLAGEMVRAAVISEQAVSPSDTSGGSYNAAAIQAQSTAISNLLIELSFVSYLNRYFMPNFSLFNRGVNGPPIRLVTENADSEDRDLIIKLMSTMGNSPASQSFYEMLDMRTLGELSHIPMLSEADAKRKADEKFQEGLDHQEAQQELISKYNVNKDGTKQFGGVPPTDNKKPPAEDKSKETQEKLEAVGVITKALIDGRELPWVLGLDELEALNEKNLIPEEVAIRLFNQYHDAKGLFAHSGSSSGGFSVSPNAIQSARVASIVIGTASKLGSRVISAKINSKINQLIDEGQIPSRPDLRGVKSKDGRKAISTWTNIVKEKLDNTKAISKTIGGKEVTITYGQLRKAGVTLSVVGGVATGVNFSLTLHQVLSSVKTRNPSYEEEVKRAKERAENDWKNYNENIGKKKSATSWPSHATQSDFKNMYRQLAKKYHPDSGAGADSEMMKKVNVMYDNKDWNGIHDIFTKLEEFVLEESEKFNIDPFEYLGMIIAIIEDSLKSGSEYITFPSDVDKLEPFVIDDGMLILDKITAQFILDVYNAMAKNTNDE